MAAALALIVSAGSTANQYLAQHVTELGYQRPVFAASANAARRMIAEKPYEMILINAPLPDELGHELALFAVQNTRAGVLMMVKAGTAEQVAQRVEQSGVLVLAKPFSGVAFRQAVHMAAASSRRLMMLQAENDKLHEKMMQLRLVSRAKCCLVEHAHMTEAEAHRYLEKQAMDTRRDRAEVAQEVLEEYADRSE